MRIKMINDKVKALTSRITQAATEDDSAGLSDIIAAMSLAYIGLCIAFRADDVTEDQVVETAHQMIDVSKDIIKKSMEGQKK